LARRPCFSHRRREQQGPWCGGHCPAVNASDGAASDGQQRLF
jgi:hypothetical protein